MITTDIKPGFYRFTANHDGSSGLMMVVKVPITVPGDWALFAFWVRPNGMKASTLVTNLEGTWERLS